MARAPAVLEDLRDLDPASVARWFSYDYLVCSLLQRYPRLSGHDVLSLSALDLDQFGVRINKRLGLSLDAFVVQLLSERFDEFRGAQLRWVQTQSVSVRNAIASAAAARQQPESSEVLLSKMDALQNQLSGVTRVVLQGNQLLPRMFVMRPRECEGVLDFLKNESLLDATFTLRFVCETHLLPRDRRSSVSCCASHSGYTIQLTRASIRDALPWLKKGVRLMKLVCSALPIVGAAANALLSLSLPQSWQTEWDANKDSIGGGIDSALKSMDDMSANSLAAGAGSGPEGSSSSSDSIPASCMLTAADASVLSGKVAVCAERRAELELLSAELAALSIGSLTWTLLPDGTSAWICDAHRQG